MNEPTLSSEPENEKALRPITRIARISLCAGIISVFPYVCLIIFYIINHLDTGLLNRILELLLFIPVFLGLLGGCITGMPLGLVGISTGIMVLASQDRTKRSVSFALTGILLGVGGIIGHLWYFLTCQWCQ